MSKLKHTVDHALALNLPGSRWRSRGWTSGSLALEPSHEPPPLKCGESWGVGGRCSLFGTLWGCSLVSRTGDADGFICIHHADVSSAPLPSSGLSGTTTPHLRKDASKGQRSQGMATKGWPSPVWRAKAWGGQGKGGQGMEVAEQRAVWHEACAGH